MTTNETNKRFKVLAVNDDRDFCECCGKNNLKRVVWIEDTETNVIQHFGTVCAANPKKAFGLDAEIKKAVTNWKNELQARYAKASRLYRAKGGKWVSNGIPLHLEGGALVAENQALYDECAREALAA